MNMRITPWKSANHTTMRVTSYTETIKPHIEKCVIIIQNVHHYEKKCIPQSKKYIKQWMRGK